MAQALTTRPNTDLEAVGSENLEDYVTFVIGGQLFGIPVLNVQDILTPENIANIPLAPPEVRGSINLRGRIVTVFDVRVRLGLPRRDVVLIETEDPVEPANDKPAETDETSESTESTTDSSKTEETAETPTVDSVASARRGTTRNHMMGVTVELKGELYTLLVDSVGDVVRLSRDTFESNPSTLDPLWREFAGGVYRLDGSLMIVLDVPRLLDFSSNV